MKEKQEMVQISITTDTYQELIMRKASNEDMNHAIRRLLWMKAVESTKKFRAADMNDLKWINGDNTKKIDELVTYK
jgi:hypothetical protein